jgi:hypothetical protein
MTTGVAAALAGAGKAADANARHAIIRFIASSQFRIAAAAWRAAMPVDNGESRE